ncbi:hypothetical protein HHI36_014660 [Cryptolaemus montrouzieri]|uniref:Uncharacterized protein n=1 Tax=Cryptolaemus montrouzieri TaxID=559131 RepID=A0ABD2N3K1_9CUCU
MLSQGEVPKWSTKQCHQVEDYLCDEDSLVEAPECMLNILKYLAEDCPRMKTYHSPDLKLLEYANILSMENLKKMEICPQQTKYYFVPSMAILHTRCVVSNTRKEIFPTATINEEKYTILPKKTTFPRKSNDMESSKNENIPDITLEELDQWNFQP